MMSKRSFWYVAFYDKASECWVAGATDVNVCAQGRTFLRAVENLKHSMSIDATLAVSEGRFPFVKQHDRDVPLQQFSTKNTLPTPRTVDPPNDKRYRGQVVVRWESDRQAASGVPWYLQD